MTATSNLHLARTLSTSLGTGDRLGIKGFVRVIGLVEFDPRIKQGAGSAAEKDGDKDTRSDLNSLPLICIRRIIQHSVCIEKEVEVVEADHRFLLEQSPEFVLVDK